MTARLPKPAPGAARPAFTILEVLLSSAIGVLLMSALYAAMTMQLRHAQTGREVVERSLLVRSLFARMTNDIMIALAPSMPLPPSSGGGSGGGPGQAVGAAASGMSAAGGSSPQTSGGATGAAATPSPTATSGAVTGTVVVNLGVQGDNNRLILNVSRLPRDVTGLDGQPPACDMRRITYWLMNGADQRGLCRQEFKPVTSEDAVSLLPPDIPDEANYLLAEEVKSLQFQYFDGSAWQDTWDGTAPGADGVTPLGPPQAVAITIEVETPGQPLKSYRHVVAIPSANGVTPAPTTTTGN